MSIRCRIADLAALKRGLLALIAMAVVATATPTTSQAQSFQGLGILPGYNKATSVSKYWV